MNLFHKPALQRSLAWWIACTAAACGVIDATADTIKTLDGRFYRGKAQLIRDGIQFAETNGNELSVTLSNLDSVVFADTTEVIAGEQSLSPPWASQDVGNVGAAGGARQETNSFTIRASGSGIGQTIDGFHFVYQPMAGDAEIVAHLSVLEAPNSAAQAGLMIRQTLGAESADAAVLLSPQVPATFQYRISRKRPNPELRGPKAPAPRWLKLEKKDKFYVGSISDDATNWKVVGSETISLGTTRNREDQWFIGLAVSSHTNGGLCSAVFDDVRVRSHGVKADFFKDEFQNLIRSTIVFKSESGREGERPAAVRWTGSVVPKFSETYHFTVEPKEASQLWIDDRLIFSSSLNLALPIFLTKGLPVQFKLESNLLNAKRPVVKLYWSSHSQSKEVVPWNFLQPFRSIDPTNSPALDPHMIDVTRAQASAAGVVLKSGTLMAGTARELDDTLLKFRPMGGLEQSISTLSVARVQFRSLSPQLAARIAAEVPGVLLANSDFIEGEIRKFANGRVTISSVIFGLRSFDAGNEAIAVVLRPVKTSARLVVRTNNGTALFAERVELDQGALTLTEAILGAIKLPASELLDLRRLRTNGS